MLSERPKRGVLILSAPGNTLPGSSWLKNYTGSRSDFSLLVTSLQVSEV